MAPTDSVRVHKAGVASFVSLPDDLFEYRIDFEEAEGRMWLKSSATKREWECVISNREVFEEDPAYCDQFNMELELLQLALHRDPNAKKVAACKHVILAKNGEDDLIMQLNEKVYSRLDPEMQPTIQFTLKHIGGGGSRARSKKPVREDPPKPTESAAKSVARGAKAVEPAATNPEEATTTEPDEPAVMPATKRAKRAAKRTVETQPIKAPAKQKETLAQLREENAALKAGTRELFRVLNNSKTTTEALLRENKRAHEAKNEYADALTRTETKYKTDLKQWRTENEQLKIANAELVKLGGMHEFQRQHIEHLRRKIQALEEHISQSSFADPQRDSRRGVAVSNASRSQASEQTQQPLAGAVSGVKEQKKRRRTTKS